MQGVVSWAVVDVALQTGQRVSEMARHVVGDFDPRRQALKVWRHKRRKRQQETLAISKALAIHLKAFITWKRSVRAYRRIVDLSCRYPGRQTVST